MRVLIVSSNLSSEFGAILSHGAAALSAYLKQRGHDVRLRHIECRRDFALMERDLRAFEPEVMGVSVNSTEGRHIPAFVGAARSWNPDVPVVLGGHYTTLNPEQALAHEGVSALCVGEGEEAFAEYLDVLRNGDTRRDVENFWFRENGEIIKNPPRAFIEDLDALPWMDRDAVDFQRVLDLNRKTLITVVGRGFCPYRCTFCANSGFAQIGRGPWVRRRSVDSVLEELRHLGEHYDFHTINFRDDNFTYDRDWLMEFCEKFARRCAWEFDCFSRCDTLDQDMVDALAGAGCRHVFVGLESGNDYIRNEVLKKGVSNEQVVRASEMLNSAGIKAVISCMIGLPHETPEAFQDTIDVCRRIHKNQIVFSSSYGSAPKILVFNPFPNTEMYKECKKNGWLREPGRGWRIYRETYLDMPQFPRRDIYRLYRSFRYQVYKDSYPFFALLFRIYDTRLVRMVTENLPVGLFSRMHAAVSAVSRWLKPRNVESKSKNKR